MIKQELVELVIDALGGGDAPDDVRGKYHPEVVSAWIALAYQQFMVELEKSDDPLAGASMVMYFDDVDVVESGDRWIAALPSTPMNGGGSIYSVSGTPGGLPYNFNATGQATYLSFLQCGKGNPYSLRGNDLVWKSCPNKDKKVYVQMIPDFRSLDYNAQFQIPNGGLKLITEYCVSVLQNKRGVKEDVNNNQEQDV